MIYYWLKDHLFFRKCTGCDEPREHSHHFTALGRWYDSRESE